jgi:hypothetical protein
MVYRYVARYWLVRSLMEFLEAALRHTIDTIWEGDTVLRDYYNGCRNTPALPGFPGHMPALPQHPYQAADVAPARTNRILPPQRNAAGVRIPPAAAGVPILPVAAGVPIPSVAAVAANVTALPVQAPASVHAYPFNFWPAQPWHTEPTNDLTLGMDADDIAHDNDNKDRWMGTRPFMWPIEDESDWGGAKAFRFGSNGFAGLWCRVDAHNNIMRVSDGGLSGLYHSLMIISAW